MRPIPGQRDEFYVGYQPHSPAGIAARSRLVAVTLVVLGAIMAVGLIAFQSEVDPGTFEFGIESQVTGLLVEHPLPRLLVGDPGEPDALETRPLVAVGKVGASRLVAGLDGTPVRVTGSMIYNDLERMIEAHGIEVLHGVEAELWNGLLDRGIERQPLGRTTLVGEIVDAKCHFGVMKPGRGKSHKACAIRCISGGVPPVLRVQSERGETEYFFLVSAGGQPVHDAVLDFVAEPVEIRGEVVRIAGMLLLYADPSDYRRVDEF